MSWIKGQQEALVAGDIHTTLLIEYGHIRYT